MPTVMSTTSRPGRFRDALAEARVRNRLPSLSVAVVTADRLVFSGADGLADVATARRADDRTSYLWFSMTKLVTATAALRLTDEGRLDLDAPVSDYLPCFPSFGAPRPTVQQLLDHTAGLTNPLPLRWVHTAGHPAPSPYELLERLMRRGRAYHRRQDGAARYSNVGYLALGCIITAVTGQPVERHIADAVLAPTGMLNTGFTCPADAPAATGYIRSARGADPLLRRFLPPGVVGARHAGHLSLNAFYVDGAAYGGLVGDVLDAARFAQLHLNDGELDGTRVLSPATVRRMRIIDRPGNPFHHGLGWFQRPGAAGQPAHVEHYGAGAGYWNALRLYPELGLGVVAMSNATRAWDVDHLFETLRALAA